MLLPAAALTAAGRWWSAVWRLEPSACRGRLEERRHQAGRDFFLAKVLS